ncbi:histidine triad nucleotide-binding protein [Neokomagataea thailandica]|uniref:Adenosine 5'-monophosphoramidase n=1 Tax=Neokomagataea tanensis NBRC 106556 TaxID=1223519 RepID=A0ABQ0QHY6_9PROT|nr:MULTISPECIES: histidine triad nucleotide-binding protein [Neokomagataea]GBR45441.1 adenosine 5'-monophosphoramidase [Neokomagataea tanensis NBRC 106556]
MTYDQNNIFSRILRDEIPCNKVYENEYALAFHDIAPHAPVHILVIPKGAYESIIDFSAHASSDEVSGFWKAVSHVADQQGITKDGCRILSNVGANGGQEVPHFHVHLLGGVFLGPILFKKL